MRIDGSCHCGKITFEGDIDRPAVGICHCTDCQALTGTAFRVSVPVEAQRFRILSGEPKTYVKTAASGNKRAQVFCGDCGTPLYATAAEGVLTVLNVRVGTLRQRAEMVPTKQIWHRSALPWLPAIDGIDTWEEEERR